MWHTRLLERARQMRPRSPWRGTQDSGKKSSTDGEGRARCGVLEKSCWCYTKCQQDYPTPHTQSHHTLRSQILMLFFQSCLNNLDALRNCIAVLKLLQFYNITVIRGNFANRKRGLTEEGGLPMCGGGGGRTHPHPGWGGPTPPPGLRTAPNPNQDPKTYA